MNKLAILGGAPIRTQKFPDWPIVTEDKIKAVNSVINKKQWDRGDLTEEFERAFAQYHDSRYCIGTTSGTASLLTAIKSLDIGAGDEVIVPAYTYIATAAAVKLAGAEPIFADIDPFTANISFEDLAQKITNHTKAVIPVHFAGLPVDMNHLLKIADKNKLYVIEDAAQAHGAVFKNRKVGSFGNFGCFSFQQSKNLSSGEGGAIITDDIKLANKAFSFHNFGRPKNEPRYEFQVLGGNFRITDIQAALLLEGMKQLEQETKLRHQNARLLTNMLKKFDFLIPIDSEANDNSRRSYYLYIMRYQKEMFDDIPRKLFIESLKAEGIPVWYGYPVPLNKHEIFSKKSALPFSWKPQGFCPEAEKLCIEAIWLPQNVLLSDENGIKDIARAVEKICDNKEALEAWL